MIQNIRSKLNDLFQKHKFNFFVFLREKWKPKSYKAVALKLANGFRPKSQL